MANPQSARVPSGATTAHESTCLPRTEADRHVDDFAAAERDRRDERRRLGQPESAALPIDLDWHPPFVAHVVEIAIGGADADLELAREIGVTIPVAAVEDVLQGKVWAAGDPSRPASERQTDVADIARRVERYPELRSRVPSAILDRLV